MENAIERVQEALVASTSDSDVARIAAGHRTLAYLLERRELGAKSTNLALALHHFKEALCHYTRDSYAEDWAHLNVAIAMCSRDRLAAWAEEGYRVRDQRDYAFRKSEIEDGIARLGDVLGVFTEKRFPEEHRSVSGIMEEFRDLQRRLADEE